MGFALIMQTIIEAKKPIVGHNCMFDWVYVYNQFIGELPDTYDEFIKDWHEKFPATYDNKVLCQNSRHFFKTALGVVYEKCTTDENYKSLLKFSFDLKHGCTNYNGQELLSHYHEAAYDAHMTGVAFACVLKRKELDEMQKVGGNNKGPPNKKKPEESKKLE
jgi:poly(A)-specific ribonuclease